MRFKRYMFLTLILFLTIFSISFVGATENVTYNQNTGEQSTLSMSDVDPIDGNLNTNVDSVDEADDDSLGKASEDTIDEIEIDGCLTDDNGTQLLRSSNDLEIKNVEIIGAEDGVEILGASNDEPVLGDNQYLYNDGTAQDVMDAIVRCSESNGGTVYLNGHTFSGGVTLTAGQYYSYRTGLYVSQTKNISIVNETTRLHLIRTAPAVCSCSSSRTRGYCLSAYAKRVLELLQQPT